MIVELKGKSLKGVIALAKNQGCLPHTLSAVRRQGVWYLRVDLPPR